MKQVTLTIGLLALIGTASIAIVAGCDRGQQQNAAMPARPPAAVTAAVAVTEDVPLYLDEIGRAVAVESVSIMPQVGGKVIAVHVKDGAFVKKGDLLFEIDGRPFEASLAAAEADVAQTKAELELAKTEFKRMEDLIANKAVSQLEYDQKKSAVQVWSAKQLAQEAAVVQTKLNVEYTKIVSPIDGRAGARLIDVGNIVKANEGAMMTIQRLDPIYAEFTITENDLGTVRKFIRAKGLELGANPEQGLKVLVDLPANSPKVIAALGAPTPSTQVAAQASTQPGKGPVDPREGTLTFLDNSVQNGAGTVKLRATVPNKDGYFWPGQFVNARLVLATKKDAVLVPAQAQQIGQQGPYLYVIEKSDKGAIAKIRPIQPGQRHGQMLVVDAGLKPGEQVVVTGQMLVAPDGPVMVTNAAALQPTTQPASATALNN